MKPTLVLVTLIVAAALLAGCASITGRPFTGSITGSRNLVEKSFDLTGFTAVEISAGGRAAVKSGDYAVVVKIDDNAVDYLRVEKRGSTLFIGLQDGSYNNVTIDATVTMPEFVGGTASGGSTLTFDEFATGKALSFDSNGGARIEGAISGAKTTVKVSGGASIALTGKGESLDLNHSGGGNTRLGAYEVGDAKVNVSGGSVAVINATGKVTGEVTGGGSLTVEGSPESINVSTSGGGQVKK